MLEEIGTEQEQAAYTLGASRWQAFWRITLPAIRWALAYGIVLSLARALGEFGAVAVVSGNIVRPDPDRSRSTSGALPELRPAGAYAAAFLLASIAIVALIVITVLRPEGEH